MLLLRFILIYLSVNMGLVVRASDPMGNLRSSVFEQSDVMDDTQDRFLRTSDDNNEASGRVANNLKGDELPYYATSGKERVLALKSDHDFANIVANEIEKRRSNINENQSSGGGASGSFGGSGVGGDYQYYDPDQKGIFKFQGFKTMKPKVSTGWSLGVIRSFENSTSCSLLFIIIVISLPNLDQQENQ